MVTMTVSMISSPSSEIIGSIRMSCGSPVAGSTRTYSFFSSSLRGNSGSSRTSSISIRQPQFFDQLLRHPDVVVVGVGRGRVPLDVLEVAPVVLALRVAQVLGNRKLVLARARVLAFRAVFVIAGLRHLPLLL